MTGILWGFGRPRRCTAENLDFLLKALQLSLCLAICQAQEEQCCFAENVLSIGVLLVILNGLSRWVGKERGDELEVRGGIVDCNAVVATFPHFLRGG